MGERIVAWDELNSTLVGKSVHIVYPAGESSYHGQTDVAGVVGGVRKVGNSPVIDLVGSNDSHMIFPAKKALFSSKVTPAWPQVTVVLV